MESEKTKLYRMSLLTIEIVKSFIKQIEDKEMTNEQFFLNFLDSLNELSVQY